MQDHRRQYRVDPGPLAIHGALRLPGGNEQLAEILDLSAGGMRLLLPGEVTPPRRGARLEVRLHSPHLTEPLHARARVIQLESTQRRSILGLQLSDRPGLRERLPQALLPLFNARVERRCRLPRRPGAPIRIDGTWLSFRSAGVLHDVSRRGLAFTAEPTHEGRLRLVRDVRLRFELPDEERPFDLSGQVCRREFSGLSTRYAVTLAAADSPEQWRQLLRLQRHVERHGPPARRPRRTAAAAPPRAGVTLLP